MINLENKVVLITGATSGIGRAMAISLAKEKCKLVCVGRNRKKLDELKNSFNKEVVFIGLSCDIADEKELEKLIKKISNSNIGMDIVIHSAGILINSLVSETTTEEFNKQFDLNIKAPYLITRAVLEELKKSRGQIVFINSSVVQRAISGLSLYSATKHALKGFADSLRTEVNACGIRVISVYPGKTATQMQQDLHDFETKTYSPEMLLQPEDIASLIVNALKLPATAETTDLFIRPFIKY